MKMYEQHLDQIKNDCSYNSCTFTLKNTNLSVKNCQFYNCKFYGNVIFDQVENISIKNCDFEKVCFLDLKNVFFEKTYINRLTVTLSKKNISYIKNITVKILSISSLGLKYIPNEVFKMKKLESLILSNNNIKKISTKILYMNLKSLDLSNNEIKKIPSTLQLPSSMKELILFGNPIEYVNIEKNSCKIVLDYKINDFLIPRQLFFLLKKKQCISNFTLKFFLKINGLHHKEVCFSHPTLVAESFKNKDSYWHCSMLCIDKIKPEYCVEIGDFGDGSDTPLLLNYEHSKTKPSVMCLIYEHDWKELAPDFETFYRWLNIKNRVLSLFCNLR
ncbi:leucine-rich repeat domain-containing protein [Candidatus Uabimicrobium amorphum]|uniref:Uncharacterized protein n=1 Tax=Uabimicrobium amorphum TaxID=2596890 RepID=A0A5S9ISX1_UABAM|nr:hypothetical protein [Candidatus Uabimicrobium amorphum]BBM87147.1 hypothetical protein UABAM_05550 [Candidatus Uabimicrobium amorphum]